MEPLANLWVGVDEVKPLGKLGRMSREEIWSEQLS